MATLSRIPLLQGLPDDHQAGIRLKPDGQLEFTVPGTAMFAKYFPDHLTKRLNRVMVGVDRSLHTTPENYGHPVINYVADGDRCSRSLAVIERFVEQLGSPCFNHPAAIRMSGRHHISARLSAVPGVVMPRTELIGAENAGDFAAQVEALGLRYPLIIRVPGTHASSATQRAVDASELSSALYALPVDGRPLYATEYVDCTDPDGLCRKLRIVLVGRRVFAKHFISAASWNVHVSDRLEQEDAAEKRMLDGFPESFGIDLEKMALHIADIVGLDYFGIDCCPRPDGSVLIFEVNAAMDMLRNSFPEDPYWAPRIATIQGALEELVFDPPRWRHQGTTRTHHAPPVVTT